ESRRDKGKERKTCRSAPRKSVDSLVMPTLRDSNLDEVLTHLENWRPYLPDATSDIFVAAVGFEDRASACFKEWCGARQGRGGKALLIKYQSNNTDNALQEAKFIEAATLAGIQVFHRKYQRLALYGQA